MLAGQLALRFSCLERWATTPCESSASRSACCSSQVGDKPHGDKPHGDKPHGDKPHGDKPHVVESPQNMRNIFVHVVIRETEEEASGSYSLQQRSGLPLRSLQRRNQLLNLLGDVVLNHLRRVSLPVCEMVRARVTRTYLRGASLLSCDCTSMLA
jgi:hypothetical protein